MNKFRSATILFLAILAFAVPGTSHAAFSLFHANGNTSTTYTSPLSTPAYTVEAGYPLYPYGMGTSPLAACNAALAGSGLPTSAETYCVYDATSMVVCISAGYQGPNGTWYPGCNSNRPNPLGSGYWPINSSDDYYPNPSVKIYQSPLTSANLTTVSNTIHSYSDALFLYSLYGGTPPVDPGYNDVCERSHYDRKGDALYRYDLVFPTRPAAACIIYYQSGPPPLPVATLTATPSSVVSGNSANLTWTCSNGATSASISNGIGSVSPASGGGVSTGALTSTKGYTVTCTNATGSGSASATVTVTASLSNLTAVTGTPIDTTVGVPTTFSGTVQNTGAGSTGGTYNDYILFYVDPGATTYAYTDSANPWTYAGRGGPLSAGISQARSGSYTFTHAGTYYYRLCTDTNTEITETQEGDNCSAPQSVTVHATAPSNFSYACNAPGTQVTLSWNANEGAANGYYVRIQDPITGVLTTTDHYKSGTSITYPVVTGRTYNAWIHTETTPSNYSAPVYIFPVCNGALPDLTASGGAAVSGALNTSANFTAIVSNLSSGAGSVNPFKVGLVICGPSLPSCSGYFETNYWVNNAALGPSGSNAVTITRPLDMGVGTFYYHICADQDPWFVGTIPETDEGNNCSPWLPVTVTSPTPTVSCTPSATSINVGGSVTYTVTANGGATGPYSWKDSDGVTGTGNTYTRTYTQASSGPGTYTMQVKATNTAYTNCSSSVTVAAPYCSVPPAAVSITANPTRVKSGGSTLISWTASNLQGDSPVCDISSSDSRLSQLNVPSSGLPMCSIPDDASVQNNLTIPVKYTISCHDSTYSTFSTASTTVNIIPAYTEF